jgi:hypothetical protein
MRGNPSPADGAGGVAKLIQIRPEANTIISSSSKNDSAILRSGIDQHQNAPTVARATPAVVSNYTPFGLIALHVVLLVH